MMKFGNAPPPHSCDKRRVRCLKCGNEFWLHVEHVCDNKVCSRAESSWSLKTEDSSLVGPARER
jgi:hypothetical protein